MERTGVSEFGAVGGSAIRIPSYDPQRSRLLAPMSMRNEPKPRMFAKPPDTIARNDRPGNIPPSRRNMPIATRPAATGMTISAQNKRTSREAVPGLSRASSKESGRDSASENSNPNLIKPSKSLHANLAIPPPPIGNRIPSSSSVGAPGLSHRKTSLLAEGPAASPAEDEETLADAEMQAYVDRRKARVAAGSKKDDLADIEEFPDDIDPAEPISQRCECIFGQRSGCGTEEVAFISKNLSSLSDYERKEVLDYDRIYYAPLKRVKREPQNGSTYNYGYDDERGDYLVINGDHMCYRYEVIKILGKGSFGQVAQCRDHKTGGSVAVKIIRNKKRFHSQALVEVKILGHLVDWVGRCLPRRVVG
jgi:dual specificity tyrosine-phosphorylation-regulated kinase 2/3/4